MRQSGTMAGLMKTVMLPLLLVLAGLAVVVGGVAFWWLRDDGASPWTTDSPQAREQLELGLAADMKFYLADAVAHFERALALDPDFAIAKLFIIRSPIGRSARAEQLFGELQQVDLERLSARERFLIERQLVLAAGKNEEAGVLVDAYAEEHPTDPFALEIVCTRAWVREDWEAAESCFHKLRELHPNRVMAQNHLGYITMAQGRFAEAEEHFRTYLYIAPDQANPHDSLGELLIIVGRYAEAEAEFREALRIKPDFCDAYLHLFQLYVFSGQLDKLADTLRQVEAVDACQTYLADSRCSFSYLLAYLGGDPEGAWQLATTEPCQGRIKGAAATYLHRQSVTRDQPGVATAIEERLVEDVEVARGRGGVREVDSREAALAHARGVSRLAAGDAAAAAELFERADELLTYRDASVGVFKLWNRLNWAESLRRTGRTAEAVAREREIAAVNPHFVEDARPSDSEPEQERSR